MAEKRLEVLITGNAKSAQKAFGDLDRAAGKSAKTQKKALTDIQKGFVGLGAGALAVGSFKAWEESEKIGRQTAAVIKSTGGEAQVSVDHVADLAAEMSKLGGVDDELVQQGTNMLLTFTKVRNEVGKGNDIFDQATLAANNYAAATGTDVVAANKLLGKVLNDPLKGMTQLTKAGVQFDDSQKQLIKTMVASGDTMGAQKIILAEFEKQFGGSLEANATASGKAQVAMENLGEAAGGVLAPGLELLAGAATAGADAMAGLPVGTQQGIAGIAGLTAAAVVAGPKVLEMAGNLKDGAVAAKKWGRSLADSGRLASTMAVGSVALGGFTAALYKMQVDADRAKNNVKDLQKQIEKGSSPAEAAASKLGDTLAGIDGGFEGLAGSSDSFRSMMEDLGMTATDTARLIVAPADEWKKASKELLDTQGQNQHQLSEFVTNIDNMRKATENATTSEKVRKEVVKELGTATDETSEKTRQAGDRSKEAAVSHQRNADALANIAAKAEDATSAIRDFWDEQTNAVATQIDAERALDDVAQSFKDNGEALSISAEGGRQNREAIIAAKDAQLEYAMTLRDTEGTGAAIESMVNYSNSLYDTLIQAGLTKDQTAALIDEMGLTPTDIYTQFRSNPDEAILKSQAVTDSINKVPGWKDIYFNALTDSAKAQIEELSSMLTPLGSSVLSGLAGAATQQSTQAHGQAPPPGQHNPPRASGGSVTSGRSYLVGEYGPEIAQFDRSGVIIPAGKTKQMLSGTSVNAGSRGYGGAVTNVFHITESKDAEATANAVAAIFRRQSRLGMSPLAGVG